MGQNAGNILHGGATETLVDLIGSAVIFTTGVTQSGVSFEINHSYLDDTFLGVRLCFCVEINFKETKIRSVSGWFNFKDYIVWDFDVAGRYRDRVESSACG